MLVASRVGLSPRKLRESETPIVPNHPEFRNCEVPTTSRIFGAAAKTFSVLLLIVGILITGPIGAYGATGFSGTLTSTTQVGLWPMTPAIVGDVAWVPNDGNSSIYGVNISKGRVEATVALDGQPRLAATSGGLVWVSIAGTSLVDVVDPTSNSLVTSVDVDSLKVGLVAGGLTANSKFVFVQTSDSTVAVISSSSKSVVQQITVEKISSLAASETSLVIASSQPVGFSIFQGPDWHLTKTISTSGAPFWPVIQNDQIWFTLYASWAGGSTVYVVGMDGTSLATIPLPFNTYQLAGNGQFLYAVSAWNQIYSIDESNFTYTGATTLCGNGWAVAVSGATLVAGVRWGNCVDIFRIPYTPTGPQASTPDAPTSVGATSGTNGAASVSWTAPGSDGGSAINSYTVTASPGGATCTTATVSCTVSSLTNGQNYTFTVIATNAIGDSPASQPSTSATPWSAPVSFGQPSVVPAPGKLTASWSPPSDTGGFPITGNTASASPGGKTCSTSGLTCTISGLDQSTPYSVQVVATNSKGLSSQSAPSIQVYAVGATSLKVKTIPFVVQTKTPFLVLAYGAPAGKLVTVGIPGSQGSCTTNAVGQCTASLSVKNPGSYTALAVLGNQHASSSFYAPSITIPLGVKHGKSFTISISNAPAKSQVLITLSDGRTKVATTSGAGAASISIPVTKVGFLVVTPSFGGVNLKSSTVLVS